MSVKKVIWSIDAVKEQKELVSRAEAVIRALPKSLDQVVPVFIFTPEVGELLNLPDPMLDLDKASDKCKEWLKECLAESTLDVLKDPEVLINPEGTTLSATQVLGEFAENNNADLIVVSTHAREGVARLFLGSFTESLINESSKTPILVVNPHMKDIKAQSSVVFATDWSDDDWRVYQTLARHCAEDHQQLYLFHQLINNVEPYVSAVSTTLGGAVIPPVQNYFSDDDGEIHKKAEGWIKWAKDEYQLTPEFHLCLESKLVTESLLDYAKQKGATRIAVGARKGTLASVFLGSETRDLIRHSELPVWVYHSDTK